MGIFALSLFLRFPWEFVWIVCAVLALAPPLLRYYSRVRWRIPLWHGFIAVAMIAFAASFAAQYIRATHSVDRAYYVYDNDLPFHTSDASVTASIPYTPIRKVLLDLCLLSVLPGVAALIASIFLLRYWRLCGAAKRLISSADAPEAFGIAIGGFAGTVTVALHGAGFPLRVYATLPSVVSVLAGAAIFGFGGWLTTRFSDIRGSRSSVISHWAMAGAVTAPTIEIFCALIALSGPVGISPAYAIGFFIGGIIGGGLGVAWSPEASDPVSGSS